MGKLENKNIKKISDVTLDTGDVIVIRIPTLLDIKAINNIVDTLEKESTLISNLTGLSLGILNKMDFDNYSLLSTRINNFLSPVGKMSE